MKRIVGHELEFFNTEVCQSSSSRF